jgi:hypothetical protein
LGRWVYLLRNVLYFAKRKPLSPDCESGQFPFAWEPFLCKGEFSGKWLKKSLHWQGWCPELGRWGLFIVIRVLFRKKKTPQSRLRIGPAPLLWEPFLCKGVFWKMSQKKPPLARGGVPNWDGGVSLLQYVRSFAKRRLLSPDCKSGQLPFAWEPFFVK